MTEKEREIVELLVKAWTAYTELPDRMQPTEFQHAIHAAQSIVMARPMLRKYIDRAELDGPEPAVE